MAIYADSLPRTPPPDVTTNSVDVTWGEPCSIQLFSNFPPPYTPICYVTPDTIALLPEGLTLGTDGTLSGTTNTLNGDVTIEVAADVGTSIYVYTVPITILGGPLFFLPEICDSFTFTYTVPLPEGVTAPYVWSVTSGLLPPGIELVNSAIGELAGICYVPDLYTFELTVNSVPISCALRVNAVPRFNGTPYASDPITYYVQFPSGFYDTYYEVYLPDYTYNNQQGTTYTLISGSLGNGLSLNSSTGVISGTYLEATYPVWTSFVIKVENPNGCYCLVNGTIIFNDGIAPCAVDEQTFSLTVLASSPIIMSPTTLPSVCEGGRYSTVLYASGGTPQYTFTLNSGTLPNGLTLSTAGVITGYANDLPGEYTVDIRVEDSLGIFSILAITLNINTKPSITTTVLPAAEQGVAYSTFIEGTGTTIDTQYLVAAFRLLPEGLTLNSATGELAGIPTQIGIYRFLIELNNSNGCYDRKYYDLTVTGDTSVYSPPIIEGTPSNICKTSYYRFMPLITNGTPPFSYSISEGILPPGTSISPDTGEITGHPMVAGEYPFNIQVTDSVLLTDTLICSVSVYDSPLIQNATLPTAVWNVPYEAYITYSGGTTPLIWSIREPLPNGLLFNVATGAITGTPYEYGQFLLTVTVVDANGCRNVKQLLLNIQGPPRITLNKLPSACQNVAYRRYITVEGGTPPYLWFITSDNVPPDAIVLNPYTGQLSGIPKVYGTFTFSIGIKDANNLYDQKDYDLLVRPEEQCAGNIDPDIPPGEPGYIELEKERAISLAAAPVVVKDPFHQLHMPNYMPTPYIIEEDK